jgi:hypothetical protein
MTVLDDRRTYPKLPHPRWRLPLLGDLLSYDADAPAQSAVENAALLGPLYEMRALGVRYRTTFVHRAAVRTARGGADARRADPPL